MEINKKFWENKNILVTGQTGFKGSWLSCIPKSFNCKLWGLSDGIIKSDNYRLLGDTKVFEDEFTLDISQPSSELNAKGEIKLGGLSYPDDEIMRYIPNLDY